MAFIGMATLSWPRDGFHWNTGDLFTVAAAAAYSAQILVVGEYASRVSYPILALVQLATVAAVMLSLAGWAEPISFRPSARLGFALLTTAFVCTALSFAVQAWAQQHTTPTRTGLIFATEPISAAFISYLTYGETLSGMVVAGAALILAGVLVVELKPLRRGSHP
jgi:drug/metabolite transporter (DMT)-like permease